MIRSLEIDVIPCLGDDRVPDYLITQLAKVLQQGSHLLQHEQDDDPPPTPSNPPQPKTKSAARSSKAESEMIVGSTAPIGEISRERFSYWCLDLLFLICSDTSKGKVSWLLGDISYAIYGISLFLDRESSRRRVAALCLPALIGRCRITLAGYVADEKIRGSLPFPRYTT